MKDLKKMREDFEREYKFAELCNKIETEHPVLAKYGVEAHVYESRTNGEKQLCGWFSLVDSTDKLNEKEVCMLLSEFPSDAMFVEQRWNGAVNVCYIMELHRYPSDAHTFLNIIWLSGGVKWHIKFPVTPDSCLREFVRASTRPLDESEITTWGIQKNRYTVNQRKFFQQLDWKNGTIVHTTGSYYRQEDDSVLRQIVECLKSQYKNEEE